LDYISPLSLSQGRRNSTRPAFREKPDCFSLHSIASRESESSRTRPGWPPSSEQAFEMWRTPISVRVIRNKRPRADSGETGLKGFLRIQTLPQYLGS